MSSNWDRFRDLMREILPRNRFYAQKFAEAKIRPQDVQSFDELQLLPFTRKADLIADQREHAPYGEILSYSLDRYCRLHQTSGTTTGKPLRWLDTRESWEWLLGCWRLSFPFMGLNEKDVFFFPFSFGPFLGFWTAFEAASRSGCLCIPGGGMTSTARLRFLVDIEATVVCCTPTYALHLAELASKDGIDLAGSSVRKVIVAGEPGGCIPATRERIEAVWGARVFDHYGMTEVGPVAVECEDSPGEMALLESEYLIEVIDPNGDAPIPSGEIGELVLTNLGRAGCPLIRYRTGDLVRRQPAEHGGVSKLVGGILGRTDDMIHVRGNNVYPGSIEAVIRRFPEIVEFRLIIDRTGSLPDLRIEIEPRTSNSGAALADAVARALRDELLFRVEVEAVSEGTLPRFEMKARRILNKP